MKFKDCPNFIWVTVEKTIEERQANAILKRVNDLITQKHPEVKVDICRASSKIWTDRNSAECVGSICRDTNKFVWNNRSLVDSRFDFTESEMKGVNEHTNTGN